jgi:predicted AlkP superfamily phosphohydrolase/phosphomutase
MTYKKGVSERGIMEIKNLVDEVISRKNKTITDEVFLLIQNDRGFMREYLELVREKGLDVVNRHIGKMVMTRYGLSHEDRRNTEPESTLISSHTEFE